MASIVTGASAKSSAGSSAAGAGSSLAARTAVGTACSAPSATTNATHRKRLTMRFPLPHASAVERELPGAAPGAASMPEEVRHPRRILRRVDARRRRVDDQHADADAVLE